MAYLSKAFKAYNIHMEEKDLDTGQIKDKKYDEASTGKAITQ